jgi:hypothetical protein
MAPGNLYYNLKQKVERRKSKMDQNKDSGRTKTWPNRMLLCTHLIRTEMKQCPEKHG